MSKIENILINGNEIRFEIISTISIVNTFDWNIYVDECSNISNFHLDDPTKHDYVFNSGNSEIKVVEVIDEIMSGNTTLHKYRVIINNDIISNFDSNLKYIKFYCTTENDVNSWFEGIYYLPEALYYAETAALRKYCQTCLDDKQMQLIMLIVFKRQLLDLAIAAKDSKKAAQIYLDICRLLNITIIKPNRANCCCINGVCNC